MSNPAKNKGTKFEGVVKKLLLSAGFRVERAGQAHQPDLVVGGLGVVDGFGRFECKCRKTGFGTHYNYLEGNYALVFREQAPAKRGREILITERFSDWLARERLLMKLQAKKTYAP